MDLGKPVKRLHVGPPEEQVPAVPVQQPVTEPASDSAEA